MSRFRTIVFLPNKGTLVWGSCLIAIWLGSFGAAFGQQPGSKTGRHRQAPVLPVKETLNQEALEPSPWQIGFSVGNQWAGDLFRVEVQNGTTVPWVGLGSAGFQTSRFRAGISDNVGFGANVTYSLTKVWRLGIDLSSAQFDVLATALIGQSGGVFLYDRIRLNSFGFNLERDLVDLASAPYAGLGLDITHFEPTLNDELAQNSLGAQFKLGYRQIVGKGKNIFIEGRLTRMSLAQGEFSPPAKPPFNPEIVLDFKNHLMLFGIFAGFRMSL